MNDSKFDDLSIETIAAALSYLNSDDRTVWVRMGMAIRAELGDSGFGIWDDWSRNGDGYKQRDARSVWKSFKKSGWGIGTLIHEAKQSGFELDNSKRKIITADEIAERRQRREAEERAAAAEIKRRQGEAARLANLTWDNAEPATTHPYLVRKGVQAHGLRVGDWPFYGDTFEAFKNEPNTLLIPILNSSGKIVSLQGVFTGVVEPLGDRAYMRDGRKSGGYHLIGRPTSKTIVVCEGYATGASIYEATGWCVAVAFDSGNLVAVAKTIRELFPAPRMIIAADNDLFTTNAKGEPYNPGIQAGELAAQAVNGLLIEPIFQIHDGDPTDFNDLHQREGLAAVSARLHVYDVPEVVEVTDKQVAIPEFIDTFTPLPHLNSKGKPRPTIENLQEILARLNTTVRYNVIKKEEEILIPGESFSIDNAAGASLARIMSRCAEFDFPIGQVGDYMTYLSERNLYNPIANWIISKPWDGVSRLAQFYDTVVPENEILLPNGRPLHWALIFRWLLSAVAAAFEPEGVSSQGLLVLQGAQNAGKTEWFMSLVPRHLDAQKKGCILRTDDRDSVKQALAYWLVELGELDGTFKKSDIAALKAFLNQQNDVLRRAYARKESNYARRTIFFASVNPKEFLQDPTGNRRYWTIGCKSVNARHGIDMQQLWAEVYENHYKQGEHWWLSNDEFLALNAANEEFQAIDPIEERIQSKLDWDARRNYWQWHTATQVLEMVGVDRPTQGDATKAAMILRRLNGGESRKYSGKKQLLVPPKLAPIYHDRID